MPNYFTKSAICKYDKRNLDNHQPTISVEIAAKLLGEGVTPGNVIARIYRGSLNAIRSFDGNWQIPNTEIERVFEELDPCQNCENPATSLVIVKYHFHHRVEFMLCKDCALKTEKSYSRKGGVLEVRAWPIMGEGWLKPGGTTK